MIWWIIGIWFVITLILSFVFGRLGLLSDDDFGVFITFGISFWPIVLACIIVCIVCTIPFLVIFLLVRTIGVLGEKSGR